MVWVVGGEKQKVALPKEKMKRKGVVKLDHRCVAGKKLYYNNP